MGILILKGVHVPKEEIENHIFVRYFKRDTIDEQLKAVWKIFLLIHEFIKFIIKIAILGFVKIVDGSSGRSPTE